MTRTARQTRHTTHHDQAAETKLRRLVQQNLAYQRKLKKLPRVSFSANRFGPLMFIFGFGLAGLAFAYQSYASTPAPQYKPATLTTEVSAETLTTGQTVTVAIWADSADQPVDAVRARLMYPEDSMELVSVDTSRSTFDTDTATEHDRGSILLSRTVSSPARLKGRQLVADVTFRALKPGGTTALQFSNDSQLFRATDNVNLLGYTPPVTGSD